jgi:hypothetical protein
MGLDTTHDCWHGSYTGFAHWRNDIARIIGWDIEDNSKVGSGASYVIPEGRVPEQAPPADEEVTTDGETYTIHWSQGYNNSVWLGQWDNDPIDYLDVLMLHSDCEGIIPHRFLEGLCHRLMDIMGEQEPDSWQRRATGQFCVGLIEAHNRGEDVGFH